MTVACPPRRPALQYFNQSIAISTAHHVKNTHSSLCNVLRGPPAGAYLLHIMVAYGLAPISAYPACQRAKPFDNPDWVFELKYDGFRALAYAPQDVTVVFARCSRSECIDTAAFELAGNILIPKAPRRSDSFQHGIEVCKRQAAHE